MRSIVYGKRLQVEKKQNIGNHCSDQYSWTGCGEKVHSEDNIALDPPAILFTKFGKGNFSKWWQGPVISKLKCEKNIIQAFLDVNMENLHIYRASLSIARSPVLLLHVQTLHVQILPKEGICLYRKADGSEEADSCFFRESGEHHYGA